MSCRPHPALRIVSVLVLALFSWSFAGLCDVAHAVDRHVKQAARENVKPKGRTHAEKLERAVEEVDRLLADPSAELDFRAVKLKAKRVEIKDLNQEIRKEFAKTEKKLKEAKLPPEILERHAKFVQHYDENLKLLRATLEGVEKAKTKEEADTEVGKKARAHLEKVKPPRKHVPLDPNKLPHRTAEPTHKKPRLKKEEFEKDFKGSPPPKPILVASAGSLAGLLSPNSQLLSPNSELRTPYHLFAQAVTPSNLPAPADLAETIEVQFTPEIKQLAEDLGYSPAKIFNFVRNYIDFVPTYGSIQGAQQTLRAGRGNAFDQASLLIALLRASGIHARYEYGTIELPIEKAKNWLGGFTDPKAALDVLSVGGIPAIGLVAGGQISHVRLEHVWVKAWIDYIPSRGAVHKQGDTWIPLDPSFKEYSYTAGVDLGTAVPFDAQGFVDEIKATALINEAEGSVTSVSATLAQSKVYAYVSQVQSYLDASYPNAVEDRIVWSREITRKDWPFLPLNLPFTVKVKAWVSPDLPSSLRHKIQFLLTKDIYDEYAGTPINFSASLPEIVGKRLTLSYAPATDADRNTIRSLLPKPHADGTPFQISELPTSFPAYLINLRPELRINGAVVATGTTVTMGHPEQLTITLYPPGKSPRVVNKEAISGEYYGIAVHAGPMPEDLVEDKILEHSDLLEQAAAKTVYPGKDQFYGEFLYTAALGYFDQLDAFEQRYARATGIVAHRLPSVGIAQTTLKTTSFLGVPYTAKPEGLFLDIVHAETLAVARDGQAGRAVDFQFITGLYGSGLEHAVLEQIFSSAQNPVEGVSAVKVLGVANSQGIPVYTITSANLVTVLPKLQTGIGTIVENAVNAGKEVITPEKNVTIGTWTGTGYIIFDPATGSGGYLISTGKNGGFLFDVGSYIMACGSVIYDEDPMYGMELIQTGMNIIILAEHLWEMVLKTAGKVAFELGTMFLPWGKVFHGANMAYGMVLGSITKNAVAGKVFEKIALDVLKSANVVKNTKKFVSSLGKTIPDGVIKDAVENPLVLWEVKSSMYVPLTGNLPKMVEVATKEKIPLNLLLKEGAIPSKPLEKAIGGTGGKIHYYNMKTGNIAPPV